MMTVQRQNYYSSKTWPDWGSAWSNEGGWGHKTGIKLYIYHPINLHGGDFRIYKLWKT